jgi:putative peptide zinc metalloprotease protein
MALSVTFHEIGHATSASYFGAKHGGIGGGFYLITPVYYADVTDIWRLSKRQRIIVNLSGMYFEIVFCSALAFLSTIFNNHTLLIISIIVCIRTLFNLNPFLRSDGYWVLSDLTNKPNLLYHSTEKAKDIARMIFKKKKLAWVSADYALMFYGVISYGFIFMLLYYVAIKNPNSIIHFPKNLFNFFKSIFQNTSEFSLVNFTELVIPLVFFILLVRLVKSLIIKQRG